MQYNKYTESLLQILNGFMQYDDKVILVCEPDDFIFYIQDLENNSQFLRQSLNNDFLTIDNAIDTVLQDTQNKKTLFVRSILEDIKNVLNDMNVSQNMKTQNMKGIII